MAAVAAFSMVTAAGAAYAQSAPTAPLAAEARFDIPAQDLGAALMAFSRIAGVAVSTKVCASYCGLSGKGCTRPRPTASASRSVPARW